MKKFSFIIILSIVFLNMKFICYSANSENSNEQYVTKAIEELERINVVPNVSEKYNENSKITRREMFEMIYVVVNTNLYVRQLGGSGRQLWMHPSKENFLSTSGIGECTEVFGYMKKEHDTHGNFYYEFEDIEYASEDHYFAFSLMGYSLINGSAKDGKLYAEFERHATVSEAITAICYMFDPVITEFFGEGCNGFNMGKVFSDRDYIVQAKELGIIDDDYAEKLNKPISAYEFMSLLYKAINIPFEFHINGWSSSIEKEYRYINAF